MTMLSLKCLSLVLELWSLVLDSYIPLVEILAELAVYLLRHRTSIMKYEYDNPIKLEVRVIDSWGFAVYVLFFEAEENG